MALVIPDGFGLAAYRFSLTGDPDVMISTLGIDTNFGVQSLQELADKLAQDFMTGFPVGALYTGWTFLGVRLQEGSGPGGSIIAEAPRTHVGTATGGTPPQNVSLLVKKQSATAGRRHRGRMFLPPFCISETMIQANGLLDTTPRNNIQVNINNAFLGDAFRILHDQAPGAPPPPPPTPITGFLLDTRVATQRRRLR